MKFYRTVCHLMLALIVISLVVIAVQSFASQKIAGQTTSQVSATLTSSGIAVNGPAIFEGIVLVTDGTNAVTVQVYNGSSASGTAIFPVALVVPASPRQAAYGFSPGVACPNGIYVKISVAGAGTCNLNVNYDQ